MTISQGTVGEIHSPLRIIVEQFLPYQFVEIYSTSCNCTYSPVHEEFHFGNSVEGLCGVTIVNTDKVFQLADHLGLGRTAVYKKRWRFSLESTRGEGNIVGSFLKKIS